MPSPIAHTAMGYVLYRVVRPYMPDQDVRVMAMLPLSRLLLITMGLSLLPDGDALLGVAMGDFGRFHNNLTHSLFVGVPIALGIGVIAWACQRVGFVRWFLLALLCYDLHVIMDFFTVGRGVMLLWPISPDRYAPPFYLFYGLHWSEGLLSTKHVWTVVTEGASVLLTLLAVALWSRITGWSGPTRHQHKDQQC